jgi:hypothetical protein
MFGSRSRPFRRSLSLALVLGVVLSLAASSGVFAAPATSETFHFSTLQQWGTPLGPTTSPSNCPAAILNDFVWIDMTGNGVSHDTTNGAGDFWATTTFTGNGTITSYPVTSLANIGTDSSGNTTATIVGPPDLSGSAHLTEWFGISANNQNGVIHGTINVVGTFGGQPMTVHGNFHAAWLPGTDPNGPPSFYFDTAVCS